MNLSGNINKMLNKKFNLVMDEQHNRVVVTPKGRWI